MTAESHPQLHDCYEQLTEDRLRRAEQRMSLDLPSDYREFVLRYNGGVYHHGANHVASGVDVAHMFGIDTGDAADVERVRSELGHVLGDNYLPIGSASTGDVLCIGIRSENFGKIALLYCNDEGRSAVKWLSPSFQAFLDDLIVGSLPDESRVGDLVALAEIGDLATIVKRVGKEADLEETNALGETILMVAAANCYPDIVDFCIRRGAQIDRSAQSGMTALHYAAKYGSLDSARCLVNAGANMNAQDRHGATPLINAIESCHTRVARYLIEAGADVRVRTASGSTALSLCKGSWALQNELQPLLMRKGARS